MTPAKWAAQFQGGGKSLTSRIGAARLIPENPIPHRAAASSTHAEAPAEVRLMPITKYPDPRNVAVADVASHGCVGEQNKWITSLKVVRGRDMYWLVGNRRDCPEERCKLRDELRAKMAAENGIFDVRDDEIKFLVEDDSPNVLARIREELISAFKNRQAVEREYLALDDVVRAWAPFRHESPLTMAKECARSDLFEAALDEHIPELLYLQPRKVLLECVIDPNGKLLDPVGPERDAAYLDSARLKRMIEIGPLQRDDLKAYLIEDKGPHCWVRREAVVAFLHKRGVDSADMPSAWLKGLPGVGVESLATRATDGINVTSAT
jgi:hypothetical protein